MGPLKPAFSPLDHKDHPELDDFTLCGPDNMSKFQSLIGTCQWMVSLCHLDITHTVMSLSHFHHCPCVGHIDPLKHICGYVQEFLHGALWFHTGIPDYESHFGDKPAKYDWMVSMYGSPSEEIPDNAPTPQRLYCLEFDVTYGSEFMAA